MKFITLTKEQFGQFCDQTEGSHFTQMAVNYDVKKREGAEVHLVGVEENGEIIAACLLTAVPVIKRFKYFYTNRGPVMDYENKSLLSFFFTELKKYLKRHKALFVRVDPYVAYQKRDHDGQILERYATASVIDELESLGYEHQGYTTGMKTNYQIRWHSVLDLTDKDSKSVLKDMDSLRKRNIKKVIKNGIKVRYLTEDELPIFREFMADTSSIKEFQDRNDDFYRLRLRHFGDRALMPLAYIDFTTYIPQLEEEQAALKINLANDNTQKNEKKKADLEKQLAALEDRLKEAHDLRAEHGDTLPVAAAFYLINPYEVVYLAGGTANDFRHFAGSYAIQWQMINYALEHGINRYNFYGISGDFSPEAEDAGVIKFKKGFNADVIEYIGDFVLPVNRPVYKVYQSLKNIKG
ncbi:aminoacyltransferase [Macrococcus carouselicus]|uniref:Aminoacyltransferase FemA n=1 Tax=Macrococcus carouselicus TaxID=69969 RepID=A0A9Q8CP79_9STAP|nr:aminoacyltransferase [Macrococcus carouselicus]TDM04200.1 aminoacyltransferase [Macrococcus carouselicus]